MDIDPNVLNALVNIAFNVASSGLTSLIATSGQKLGKLIEGKGFAEKQQIEATSLQPILQAAINDVAAYGHWDSAKGFEIISLFLCSPEVEEIIRQVYATNFIASEAQYATKLIASQAQYDLSSIRKTFLILLKQYVAAYPLDITPETSQLTPIADVIFDLLLAKCDLLLTHAIDKGILAAHEAKENLRYNVLHSQVAAIQKELELLTTSHKMDREAILEFEKQYREQVGQRHGHITPPNLEAARPYPIDDLYVYPGFETIARKDKMAEELKKDQFLSCIYRAVLLGNPGGGKSTLTLKLCSELANNYSQRIFAGRKELTPILVILRNYGADKKERKCSILDFIEAEAKATYQLPASPHNAFQYLLLTGRAMVIFDGLDELLDTSYRQEIRSDVELFCHLYPSVPVLVTSREVGYEQAPLDEKLFEVFRLAKFDDEQVQEYVKKWFAAAGAEDLAEKRRQSKAEAFLKDSKIVPDLRSNPLMLALLCSIYREENYIPRYRPDVYEKCALMLFERWDKSRSIYTPPLPEEHVRPLIEYLAHWIYENTHLRAGITTEELATKTTAYLHEWIYENIHKAEKTSNEFIKFCTGRAWVFTDTGTKRDGENLYQFAHTTFLEYFAAAHLVRSCRTPQDLLTILMPRIASREWDVMAQLAFQLQSKRNIGAGDELLTALIEQTKANKSDEEWNLLSFAIRCLQFIVPRPQVRRQITEACVEYCIAWGCVQAEKDPSQEDQSPPSEKQTPSKLVNDLQDAVPENCTTIADCLNELLIKRINSDNDIEALMALEFAISLSDDPWYKVSDHIFDVCADRITALLPKSSLLCQQSVWRELTYVSNYIKLHGFESLYNRTTFTMFPDRGYVSTICAAALYIENNVMSKNKIYPRPFSLKVLEDIVNNLISSSPPWITDHCDTFLRETNLPLKAFNVSNPTLLFSILVIFALIAELDKTVKKRLSQKFRDGISINTRASSSIYLLLCARFRPDLIDIARTEVANYGFTPEQQRFILSWIQQEITLVEINK